MLLVCAAVGRFGGLGHGLLIMLVILYVLERWALPSEPFRPWSCPPKSCLHKENKKAPRVFDRYAARAQASSGTAPAAAWQAKISNGALGEQAAEVEREAFGRYLMAWSAHLKLVQKHAILQCKGDVKWRIKDVQRGEEAADASGLVLPGAAVPRAAQSTRGTIRHRPRTVPPGRCKGQAHQSNHLPLSPTGWQV